MNIFKIFEKLPNAQKNADKFISVYII